MEDSKRILWHLQQVPLLASLRTPELQHLAETTERRELRRRDIVYLPGDPGESLFLIASGRVKISKVTRDGKALTLSYCGACELFGETSLIDGSPRQEMAEATEKSTLCEMSRTEFEKLLAKNAGLGLQMIKLLAKRRLHLENKVETLVFKDVTSKLAELLVDLATEYGVEEARGTLIALKITHQELANLIGSTRETVSLTLGTFKQKQFLITEGRKVILTNSESLRALY